MRKFHEGGSGVRVLFFFFFFFYLIFFFFFFFHDRMCLHSNFFINWPYDSGLFNMSDRKAIRAQARQIAAQVLKVCEEEARNEALSVHSTHHKLHFLHTDLNQTRRGYKKAHNDKILVLYVLNTEYHFTFSINASTPSTERRKAHKKFYHSQHPQVFPCYHMKHPYRH